MKAEKHGASHLFHLVMTGLTFGLWTIVWFFVATRQKYRCSRCGAQTKLWRPFFDPDDPEQRLRKRKYETNFVLAIIGSLIVIGIFESLYETENRGPAGRPDPIVVAHPGRQAGSQ